MRISPIILFSVDFIIYVIFGEDLSQDLSARHYIIVCPYFEKFELGLYEVVATYLAAHILN